MANTPHELAEEFPQHVDKIRELKTTNTRFARLFDEYHEVNRAVHRAEADIKPTDDFNLEDMRKKRMVLKDDIYGMLTA